VQTAVLNKSAIGEALYMIISHEHVVKFIVVEII